MENTRYANRQEGERNTVEYVNIMETARRWDFPEFGGSAKRSGQVHTHGIGGNVGPYAYSYAGYG
jgi:hypothetical protein